MNFFPIQPIPKIPKSNPNPNSCGQPNSSDPLFTHVQLYKHVDQHKQQLNQRKIEVNQN